MNPSLHLVVGLGKTGHSIARFLQRRNQSFIVFDTRDKPAGLDEFVAEFPQIDVYTSELPIDVYPQLIDVISSPGVPLDHPVMKQVSQRNIPIIGDIECFAREVQSPVIAITGTNGKSTVTTLVGEMAKSAGLSVAVAGNIGTPVLDLLDDNQHYDLWVLELSSFQLDLIYSLAPIAATILNITPDHLDRHHSFDAYVQAKQRVYHQAEFLIYNRDDSLTHPKFTDVLDGAILSSFGLDEPAPNAINWGLVVDQGMKILAQGLTPILPVNQMRIKGRHNWSNALAACGLAHAAGIATCHMVEVLNRFTGLPHRSQWVRTLDGVDWINDSKGTNVGATVSAISGLGDGLTGKIVLIAGGQSKGANFSELYEPMIHYVRSLVLIGEDADKIEQALSEAVPILHAPSIDDAINLARSTAIPGDIVLLSPACASFDMFRDFNHRGEIFTSLVCKL